MFVTLNFFVRIRMSQKIDPREVLTYLNELGYTNINAQQLKDFIIDLKKLIKYDIRFLGEQSLNATRSSVGKSDSLKEARYCNDDNSDYCECSESSHSDKHICQPKTQVIDANKAKDVEAKDKQISVHILKKQKATHPAHCIHVKDMHNECNPELTKTAANSGTSRTATLSCASRGSKSDSRSKVAFIRPSTAKVSINKSDPVALYHYYKSEWKKSKIPGQVSRDDLRWAIRTKMAGGPKVEVKRSLISNKRSSCCR
ncbi:uncharacterized protein LOC132703656 [Cylas formicarius]|uniref:uncharacterized protein LOC132703656 n=1 Tax=Cylas formicarius TaxID=197179 RepID=UPI002958541D|nr:uncharacterized protein LOC132703656 [Cylas formicarius]